MEAEKTEQTTAGEIENLPENDPAGATTEDPKTDAPQSGEKRPSWEEILADPEYRKQYDELTAEIESIRNERMKLLDGAEMPLDGLSVEDGVLTYHGQAWDNMSGAEQLKCAAAIIRKLNPECGFVLMDKLEQMDLDTLREFGAWLEAEGLQVLATRVSTGEECAVIIEDGYSHGNNTAPAAVPAEPKTWKAGEF
jgi:hypothetical protein